jgi:hypothetical protein
MRALAILVVVLALPAPARAGLTLPAQVVPGDEVVVRAETAVSGGTVRLSPVLPGDAIGRALGGVVGADGVARFVMPSLFGCLEGCSGERRFLPGQRVDVSVCSPPEVGGSPAGGIITSSTFCLGGSTVVGGRVRAMLRGRVEPRRAGVLRSARWTGWGGGPARARGTVGGRRATAVASGMVDCSGVVAYSTLTVRQGGRAVQTLRDLAPC